MTQDKPPRMAYVGAMTGRAEFARVVRDARKRHGWTQEELAAASGVGRRTIIRWEGAQEGEPRAAEVSAAFTAMGLSAEEAFRALRWLPAADDAAPQPDHEWIQLVREHVDEIRLILERAEQTQQLTGEQIRARVPDLERRIGAPPGEGEATGGMTA